MKPHLSLRQILITVLAILNLIIAIPLGITVHNSAINYSEIERLEKGTIFSNLLFSSQKYLAQERSISLAALFIQDKESRAELTERREAVDINIATALKGLSPEETLTLHPYIEKVKEDQAALKKIRLAFDTALSKHPAHRTADNLPEEMLETSTRLINSVHTLIEEYQRPLLTLNSSIARQMRFAHVIFEVTEHASKEYTVLGQLVAEERYPTEAEREKLALWRGRINYGWEIIHSSVLSNVWTAEAKPTMDEAETHYFLMFDNIKDIFNAGDDAARAEYPLTMTMWLELASQAVESLYAMNDKVLEIGQDYMAKTQTEARWAITMNAFLFISTMALSLFLWRQIIIRVIRPVDTMVHMLSQATEGIYTTPPSFFNYPKEIAQLGSVLGAMHENSKQLAEQRDKAQEASIAKSEFIANVSHELRTPMNVLMGISEILSRTAPLTNQQKEFINTLRASGKSLLILINDLLDLSAIDRGSNEINLSPFSLERLAKDIHHSLSIGVNDRKITTHLELNGIENKLYLSDQSKIRQIITNLYGNALKFTERGEITFYIQSQSSGPGTEHIVIKIADTGIGIPPEKLEAVFGRFVQVDSSLTRKYGGTGLGLAITKDIIEMLGGSIELSSTLGQGSVFSVFLNLRLAHL